MTLIQPARAGRERVRRALKGDRSVMVSRTLVLDDIRVRSKAQGGDGRTVDAYAARFMSPAEIIDDDGHYLEQIDPHAFDNTIAQRRGEIFCIYNHGRSLGGDSSDLWSVPLGEVVDIHADKQGLFTSTRYNPDDASDRILQAIISGSLKGMSFTGVFLISDPELGGWGRYAPRMGGDLQLVTRMEIALIEYGPTPIPAYDDATVTAVRSREAATMRRASNRGGAALGYSAQGDPSGPGITLQDSQGGADIGYRDQGATNSQGATGQPGDDLYPQNYPYGGSRDAAVGYGAQGDPSGPGMTLQDNQGGVDIGYRDGRATGPLGFHWDPDGDGDNDAYPGGDLDHSHWSADGQQLKPVPGRPLDGQSVDGSTGRTGPTPDMGYGLVSAPMPSGPQASQVNVTGNQGADMGYRGMNTEYPYGPNGNEPVLTPGAHPAFPGTPNSPARAGGPSDWPAYPGTPTSGNRMTDEYPYGQSGNEPAIAPPGHPAFPGTPNTPARADGLAFANLEHGVVTGTHGHHHGAHGGPDNDSDGVHYHSHSHWGDNIHQPPSHSHDGIVDSDGTPDGRAGYLGYAAPEPSGPGQLGYGPTTSAGAAVGYHGTGGMGNQGDVPVQQFGGPVEPPNAWTQQRDQGATNSQGAGGVGNDLYPQPGPGGSGPGSRQLNAPNGTATGKPGDDLYPQSSGSTGRARQVSRTWDAGPVWAAGAASSDPSKFYASHCAGRRQGDPDKQSSWALPHHNVDGSVNQDGVSAALGRLDQTQGLINKDSARAHLLAHQRGKKGSGSNGGTNTASSSGRNPAAASAIPRAGTGTGTGTASGASGPQSHPATVTTSGANMRYGQQPMTVDERRSRLQEVEARLGQIDVEHTGEALPPDVEQEWNALLSERDVHQRNIIAATSRSQVIRQIAGAPQQGYTEGVMPGQVGYHDDDYGYGQGQIVPPAYGDGNGGPQMRSNGYGAGSAGPALLRKEPIWDLTVIRQRAHSFDDLPRMYRDEAMRAVEVSHFPSRGGAGQKLTKEDAQTRVADLLDVIDDKEATIARRILLTGSPLYERAFSKIVSRLSTIGLTGEEEQAIGRALALGTDGAGGFAVPFQLDPTVILTSNGVINPLRQISRIEQITGKEWDGVTSLGVTVTRVAEGAEAGSADAALVQPNVRTNRVMGFVPFNIELDVSWAALRSTMTSLLMDAKDVEEATSFLTGSGTAPAANGLLNGVGQTGVPNFGTANANQVTTNSGTTSLQIADIYNLEDNMPPRFRAQSSYISSKTIFNVFRQLFQQQAAFAGDAWVHADAGQPARLNGYPAYEASQMPTALTTNNFVFLQGDFQQFLIVDRIGMGIELVPQLFGGTNRYPTGQRGILAIWFNNCKLLVPNAFRALRVGP